MSSTNPEDGKVQMNSSSSTSSPANMPTPTPPPAVVVDVEENQNNEQTTQPPANYTITGILRRWRHEDMLKRGSLALRSLGLLFSLLSFIIMATNEHGDWKDFDKYEEFRYVLAISILSSLYTGFQSWRQVHEMSTGKDILSGRNFALIDFFGDQIMAYLLISAASSGVPMTNRMREGADNIFTDALSASIAFAFFAFFVLGSSAILSGYKLAKHTNI